MTPTAPGSNIFQHLPPIPRLLPFVGPEVWRIEVQSVTRTVPGSPGWHMESPQKKRGNDPSETNLSCQVPMSSIRGYFSSNGRMSFLVPAKAPCDRVSGGPGMIFRPWVGRWSPHVPFFPFGHLTVCYWTSPFLWIGHIYIIVRIGYFHPFSFDFRFKMWTKLRNISVEGERGYMFGGYVWWVLWIWHLTCLFWLVVWNIFYFSVYWK